MFVGIYVCVCLYKVMIVRIIIPVVHVFRNVVRLLLVMWFISCQRFQSQVDNKNQYASDMMIYFTLQRLGAVQYSEADTKQQCSICTPKHQ